MKPEEIARARDIERIKKEIQNLVEQKIGLAKMQSSMIDKIRENPDISKDELVGIADSFLDVFEIPDEDREKAHATIDKYVALHSAVKDARESHPDDRDLYKYLFNKEPKGKVEIVIGPIVIYVRCYDNDDFALGFSGAFEENRDTTPEEIKAASTVSGTPLPGALQPELVGTIIMENNTVPRANQSRTFEHEEQHAIKRLFEERERENTFTGHEEVKDKKEAKEIMERFLRIHRKNTLEMWAKDEILAFMKTGDTSLFVNKTLTQSVKDRGEYDYAIDKIRRLKQMSEKWNPIFRKAMTDDMLKKVFEDEYRAVITDACNAFEKLVEESRLKRQDVVNLLSVEPLSKWKKLAERITDNNL